MLNETIIHTIEECKRSAGDAMCEEMYSRIALSRILEADPAHALNIVEVLSAVSRMGNTLKDIEEQLSEILFKERSELGYPESIQVNRAQLWVESDKAPHLIDKGGREL